jgi:SAM-dependent methyltransferase
VRAGLHCAPLIHNKLNTAPQGTVRISVGHFNTSLDIDFFIEALQTLLTERNPLMVVTDYYNQNAMQYIDRTKDFDVSNIFYPFVALLPPHAKVLDLGCGSGRDSLAFLRFGFDVLAIDGSEEMVKYVHSLGIPVRQMFFEDIDFDNEFDAIWCCASLLHVKKEALPDVLLRIEKALKPGGYGFVSFKKGKGEGFESGRYFHYVDELELRKYLSRFDILSVNSIASDQNLTPTVWINAVIRKK